MYPEIIPGEPLFIDFNEVAQQRHRECNNRLMQKVRFSIIPSDQILSGHQTRFAQDCVHPNLWMMPHDWKEEYGSIRGSVQYIMIKIKMAK